MKLSTERKVSLGFGAGLIILPVIGTVSYDAIYELVRAAELRYRVERVLAGLKDVLWGLDASGKLTGDSSAVKNAAPAKHAAAG